MDEARLRQLKHKGDFYSARKEERERESAETLGIILLLLTGIQDTFEQSTRTFPGYFLSLLSTPAWEAGFSVRDHTFDNVAPFSSFL